MKLEVRAVSFAYAGEAALREVSLTAKDAELIALTGPNGSGKSTLLKLIARVQHPHSGELLLDGRRLAEWSPKEYARRVGYLPQEPDTAFPTKAIEVVVSGRAPFLGRFAWETAADYRAAERALDLCDASGLRDRYLDEMSGGERKRVFLARVLAADPELIVLDEPLAALDVAHVQQFAALLRQIVDTSRASVIFAAHDLNWAAAYSDRMLVMQRGVLELDGAPAAVMQPDVVRRFFGFDAVRADRWLVPRV